jgi:hypothetical protein
MVMAARTLPPPSPLLPPRTRTTTTHAPLATTPTPNPPATTLTPLTTTPNPNPPATIITLTPPTTITCQNFPANQSGTCNLSLSKETTRYSLQACQVLTFLSLSKPLSFTHSFLFCIFLLLFLIVNFFFLDEFAGGDDALPPDQFANNATDSQSTEAPKTDPENLPDSAETENPEQKHEPKQETESQAEPNNENEQKLEPESVPNKENEPTSEAKNGTESPKIDATEQTTTQQTETAREEGTQ